MPKPKTYPQKMCISPRAWMKIAAQSLEKITFAIAAYFLGIDILTAARDITSVLSWQCAGIPITEGEPLQGVVDHIMQGSSI